MTDDHYGNGRTIAETQRSLIAKAREQARESRSTLETSSDADSEASGAMDSVTYDSPTLGPPHDSFTGYQILGELHHGGQGIVYQAIQKSTHRKVAIKVMKEGPFASVTDRARFDREVQVLGQLQHPNIVAIHGTGIAAGHYYFVMDYVHGQPLDVFIAGRRHSLDDILRLFAKICDAVSAAHLRGVIHRDLKPTNIRIDDEGEPHILDFGLAKSAPGDTDASVMTVTGQFVGSLPWASPEQAEGVSSGIDIRTDVYSLGVMFFQMLTGRFPYDIVGNMRDVLDRILRAEPLSPRVIRSEINDEIETILLKCLEKERDRRYQSAGELARDIRHYLNGEPIEAKRNSSWYVLRKQLRKHRLPVAIVTAFVLLVTIGLIVTATAWRQAASQRDAAQAAHDEADRERDAAEESRAQAEAVTDFLTEMLGSANPYRVQRADLTVREVLDSASQRLETSFQEQPLVKAAIHDVISGQYSALALFALAEPHAQAALDLRRQWLPADHPDIAASLAGRASAAAFLGRFREAEVLAREALNLQLKIFGPKHEALISSLGAMAMSVAGQGRYAEAEPYYREVAALTAEFHGAESVHSIIANWRLANCLADLGRLEEVESILGPAVEQLRQLKGHQHPDVANLLSDLASAQVLIGKREGAEAALRESLDIRRKAFGKEHTTIANSLNSLAFALVEQGRFEEAEPLYEESLEMRRRVYGPRRVEVTYALSGLARLYLRTDRPVEAEELLRESLSVFDETLPTHWRQGYAQCLLGAALTMQGRFDEAEPLLVDGLSIVRKARGDGDAFSREVLQYAIDLFDAWGKPDQANQFRALLRPQ